MQNGQFWLIAGPNGAGKTTLTSRLRNVFPALPQPLNPDAVSLELLKERGFDGFAEAPSDVLRECFLGGANWVAQEIETRLGRGESVGVETVLSTEKYLPLFREMSQSGGANLLYVGNQRPEISIERVAARVQKGGHDVPAGKIRSRWQRSLKLLPVFLDFASQAWVFDHSHFPARPVAVKSQGHLLIASPTLENDVIAETLLASPFFTWSYADLSEF